MNGAIIKPNQFSVLNGGKMSVLDVLAVTYNETYNEPGAADAAAAVGGAGVFLVLLLGLYLLSSFFLYRVFEKAGRPGWIGFVPIYNSWVLFEISGKPGWWALLIIPSLIPLVGFLFSIAFLVLTLLASLELAKRFGRSQIFAVFGLWLFSLVGLGILAFDSSKYRGSGGAPANSAGANTKKTPEVFTNNKSDDNSSSQTPPPANLVR